MGKRNIKLEKILESNVGKKLYNRTKEKENFINIVFSLAKNNAKMSFRTKGLSRINLLLKEDGLLYEVCGGQTHTKINRGKRYWTVKKLTNEAERVFEKTFTKYVTEYNYNYDESRKRKLKDNFDITPDEYNQMLQNQNGCCAICGKHFSEFDKSLAVDHNHINGENRGLLCFKCNILLGYAEDDIEILQNSIIYLEQWKK